MSTNQFPKYDPRLGMWLCRGCWNNQNWRHHCEKGLCECIKAGCNGLTREPKTKFTGEGQTNLTDLDLGEPLNITKDS